MNTITIQGNTARIKLQHGAAIISATDVDKVSDMHWLSWRNNGRVCVMSWDYSGKKPTYRLLHRVITGVKRKGVISAPLNRDYLDCRRENLWTGPADRRLSALGPRNRYQHAGTTTRIQLPHHKEVLIDRSDWERCRDLHWTLNDHGRVVANATHPKKYIQLSRHILGVRGKRKVINRDGNPLDCRRRNMQVLSGKTFSVLRRRGGGKLKGAYRQGSIWMGMIRIAGKLKYLGSFQTAHEAARAYAKAAQGMQRADL